MHVVNWLLHFPDMPQNWFHRWLLHWSLNIAFVGAAVGAFVWLERS